MIKWIVLAVVLLILIIFAVRVIKTMLKIEKDSKKPSDNQEDTVKQEEYVPENSGVDIRSSSATIMTDMSSKANDETSDFDFPKMSESGFYDDLDDDFTDFSQYANSYKGRGSRDFDDLDFDLDGDFADEYIPSSPEFSYIPRRQPTRKKEVSTELNEMSTELKVLMLSDIFDRKFFD